MIIEILSLITLISLMIAFLAVVLVWTGDRQRRLDQARIRALMARVATYDKGRS